MKACPTFFCKGTNGLMELERTKTEGGSPRPSYFPTSTPPLQDTPLITTGNLLQRVNF